MHKILLLLFLASASLQAEKIDPNSSSFEIKEERRLRIDTFDFSGDYPNLSNIDIDGKRKKIVQLILSGNYPLLEKIRYEGSFGEIAGTLTGHFPKLQSVDILSKSAAMALDLRGNWEQSCEIHITGSTEAIAITLPKDVGVIIHTKTEVAKVVKGPFKQKGWGLLKKTFYNEHYGTSPITLTVHVETSRGSIILN